jgi:O-succinylbenzoate synthase
MAVIIKGFELRQILLPLVRPFRTSFGTQHEREVLLVRAITTEGVDGWAECVAMSEPLYSPEYVAGARDVIERFLAPALLAAGDVRAEEVAGLLKPFLSHQMAKAALETAILDAQLKYEGVSFGSYLGATKTEVDCGVSVGISPNIDMLMEEVGSYVKAGYRRIKLKIEPGWDVEPVREVRNAWPEMPLQVDANQAYTRDDASHLALLDPFNLLLIEQPLDEHLAMPCWRAKFQRRSALMSRSLHTRQPVMRLRWRRQPSSTLSLDAWAATWSQFGFMTCALKMGLQCGVAGCSRPESVGRQTSR